ncbi:MFS transporter-like protein [Calycina marina]|uniref:MFS transporter-like protein n=1 Tax=Calycina marina TaxID=1763456 RepID=A0A9P7YZL6_9HELO|nr:MFS transporter-like protein [Calycina marina]
MIKAEMTWRTKLLGFVQQKRVLSSTPPPAFLKFRSSNTFIITTICIAVFSDIFLYGVIVPVMPFALTVRAGTPVDKSQSYVSILLSVYGGALLIGSPIAGFFADRSSSRRMPLLLGLFALCGSTTMLMLARNVALMIVGRILQGFSGSIVWTVGIALLVDTVGEKDIGQVLGYISLSMSLGILVAPLLGGVLYEKSGYYSVFYVAFALIAVDIALRLILVEKKIARQWLKDGDTSSLAKDEPQKNTSSDANSPETEKEGSADGLRVDRNTAQGPLDEKCSETAGRCPSDVASPPPIVMATRGSNYPPVLTLLKSRRLLAALWGCTVQGSLLTSIDSVIPLYVQQIFGWNSIGAGLIFLAVIGPSFLAPGAGWLSDRYGPRWLVVFSFLFNIPPWILLRYVIHNSTSQKVLLCALLALIGFALAIVMPPISAEITYVVAAKEKKHGKIYGPNGAYAQAYGLFIAAFAAGTLIGPLWAGYVRDTAGWATMAWSLSLLSLAAAIPCMIWTGGLITKKNARSWEERKRDEPAAGAGSDAV